MKRLIATLALAGFVGMGTTTDVSAQESGNRVGASTDWSIFVEDNPTQCWAVSTAKSSENTKNGRAVAVNRGDVLLWVTYQPSQKVKGQVSFTGGYPFAEGSTVALTIGNNKFDLFTVGENAWSASPSDDAKIIAAMKRGAKAVLVARSKRGTQTKDTFSLLGFTAMVDEAGKRCGG